MRGCGVEDAVHQELQEEAGQTVNSSSDMRDRHSENVSCQIIEIIS